MNLNLYNEENIKITLKRDGTFHSLQHAQLAELEQKSEIKYRIYFFWFLGLFLLGSTFGTDGILEMSVIGVILIFLGCRFDLFVENQMNRVENIERYILDKEFGEILQDGILRKYYSFEDIESDEANDFLDKNDK